jgi:hypothetical protein
MKKEQGEIKGILTFLERVKNGEYALVEAGAYSDVRIEEESEFCEEVYYYGLS